MISSTSNQKVKFVNALLKKSKVRNEEKLFVVEGLKMFEELSPEFVEEVFLSESLLHQKQYDTLLKEAKIPFEVVSDPVFAAMSDTRTPQGILAIVRQFSYELKDLIGQQTPAQLLILERIQDPGNLGTMLRAGEGAGVTGVIMDDETVDIYNPKVIRSTMGSIYRVPFLYCADLKKVILALKQSGVQLFAADLSSQSSYEEQSYEQPVGFLIGNEAQGLKAETAALADTLIKIPMAGKVESLNAAIAAAVLMFEVARQRR